MSDNYHYEDGAKHYDHKKVLHIDSVGSGDIEKLISAFFKDGAEDAEVLEELKDESISSARHETKPLENTILKKNHNGKRIDFQALHKMLGESFVDEIKFGYEWLAPWRMLYDLSLLEDTTLTAFAEQMNKWYPDAKKPCSADSMGDYSNPYLGSTSFVLWDENEFKKRKTSKQSVNGYRLLYNDCEAIKEALKSFLNSREHGRDKE
jgi:hypothetical protein